MKTLTAMAEAFGPHREVCLVRELTKRYEEALRCTLAEALSHLAEHPAQGEYVIVVRGSEDDESASRSEGAWWAGLSAAEHVARYEAEGAEHKEALKRAASDRGVPKRELYNELHRDS
ncbi:hypothetical protein LJK88_48570 [Paenibacillus sp. P26]|nr:hypothetical protein LJK88_48570 [Paenibacillus sp. P26]UUZ91660.1 hypothetical protein LJK87_39750 [Paenibacillus sp. P25]